MNICIVAAHEVPDKEFLQKLKFLLTEKLVPASLEIPSSLNQKFKGIPIKAS